MSLLASAAMAIEIVFDPAVDKGTFEGTASSAFSVTKDGVTLDISNGMIAKYKDVWAYRVYKGQTATITSSIGDITGIGIYGFVRNDTTWGAGGFVADLGQYTANAGEYVGNWYGSNSSIVLKAEAYQVRAIKIIVLIDEPQGLQPPFISPAAGTYYEPVEISISCSTPDATIHYTTDGSEPTVGSPQYISPFVLDHTTTVKAISALDGEVSGVVTAQYVISDEPRYGLGNLKDVPDGTQVKIRYDATVICQGGINNNYLYAFDETGFGVIYGQVGETYDMGDVIPAGFSGKKTTYNDEPELASPLSGFRPSVRRVHLTPEEITASQVDHDHWAHYVLIKNATISSDGKTITDANGNTCEMYSGIFNVALPSDLSVPHDVFAVVGKFRNYQIMPLAFDMGVEGFGFGDVYPPYQPGERLTFTYDATVLLQYSKYLYAKDPTGFALIYGETGQTYNQGDIIPGGFSCTVAEYNGMTELANPQGFMPSKGNKPLVPESAHLDNLGGLFHYVTVQSVTITPNSSFPNSSSGNLIDEYGNTCTYYDPLGILQGAVIDQTRGYTVYGIVTLYHNDVEILLTRVDGLTQEPSPVVASIAQLYDLPAQVQALFETPLIAVYQDGYYLYVKDVEGDYGLVYGTVTDRFRNGDTINNAVCSWSQFGQSRHMIPDGETFVSACRGPLVEPEEIPIEEISRDMEHWFVKFCDVTLEATSGDLTPHYTMSDGTGEMTFDWPARLPKGEDLRLPCEVSGEVTIADINFLIDIILSSSRYKPWDGLYDVTGFVKIDGHELTITPCSVSCDGHGYDLSRVDINGDGEINIADVNELIEIIWGL